MTKSVFKFVALCLLLLANIGTNASHFMGVDITYECLPNGCTYRVYHSTYYDCAGAAMAGYVQPVSFANPYPAPGTFNFQITGTPGGCVVPAFGGAWTLQTWEEVTPVCPGTTTQCFTAGAAISGVVGATYYTDYDLCNTNCTSIQIQWDNCCRNYAITSGADGDGMSTDVTTINLGFSPCNSSPQFSVPPVPYICAGQPFTFSQGAFDPDGDSLTYSIGPCYSGVGVQVGYNAGYSPTSPLGPGWSVTINNQTGDITCTPTPNGPVVVGVLCVYVNEWRYINGVPTQIGQVERDIQFTVINCNNQNQAPIGNTTVPNSGGVSNLTGGTLNTSNNTVTITGCAGVPLGFDFTGIDVNATGAAGSQNYCMWWTSAQILPGMGFSFVNAANPAQVDSFCSNTSPLVANIDWTPPAAGVYFLTISLQDDACPILGLNQYTIQFNINCCTVTPIPTYNINGCNTADFQTSVTCGVPPFNYTWTGINFTFSPPPSGNSFTYTFPSAGTYYYQVSVLDALGNGGFTLDTIVIGNNALANAGPDIVLCPNQTGTIGTPALPGYTYQWSASPAIGFTSATNIAQPTVALNVFTSIPQCVTYTVTVTDSLGCSNTDNVLVCFNPTPASLFSLASPICEGDCSTMSYLGVPPANATYNWNFGGGIASPGGNSPGPHTVCFPNSGIFNVSLQVTTAIGCSSNVTINPITVHPNPSSSFTVSGPVCVDEPSVITYTGNASPSGTYTWDFDGATIISGGGGQGPHVLSWPQGGTKIITLTVSENGCVGTQTAIPVQVNDLPVACFTAPNNICPNTLQQVVYACSSGPNATYDWSFGPAVVVSGGGQGPYTLSWTSPGLYPVCLQVTENGCVSRDTCMLVNVIPNPVAGIVPVPNQCFNGNSFSFVSSGTPNMGYYSWNFGASAVPSSTIGTATPANIQYLSPGPKVVTLYVTQNGCGSALASTTFDVVPEPSADFTVNTNVTCLGDCINFAYSGSSNLSPQAYSWNFGPNASPQFSTLPNPGCVTFTAPGFQTIQLVVDHLGCTDTTIQQIFVRDAPQVNAGIDQAFCDGESDVLDASVSGGTLPYGYSWWSNPVNGGLSSPFVEDPMVTPTDTTVYCLQVTDAYGCKSNIDCAEVVVLPKPQVNAGPDKLRCDAPGAFGVTLNGGLSPNNQAPGPFQYSWTCNTSPNCGMALGQELLEDPTVFPSQTTIYTLIVTSANGCSSDVTTLDTMSTTTVFVNPLPIVNAGPDRTICFGDTIQMNGFADNAGPLYTYQWTPAIGFLAPTGANDPVAFVKPPFTQNYTLSATSNGCTGADNVLITVTTLPTASIEPPVWDICQGESVTLNGLADGDPFGTIYTYSWVPSTGLSDSLSPTPIASPNTTTTYQLIAGTGECVGFVDAITITVRPTPITNITNQDTLICAGDSVQLNALYSFVGTTAATPIVFQWSPTTNMIGGTTANPIVFPTANTTYKATISVAGSCPTSDEVTILVSPKLDVNATADKSSICAGETVGLNASSGVGNATYSWSPAATLSAPLSSNTFATPLTTTTYYVSVNEGSCGGTDSVVITVNPQPQAVAYASNLTGCVPVTVSFYNNSLDNLGNVWNFGDGSPAVNSPAPIHTFTQPGSYLVTYTATGVAGCNQVMTLGPVVVVDTAFAAFSSNPPADSVMLVTDANVLFTDNSPNSVNWLWDFGDGTTSASSTPRHVFDAPGEYLVSLFVTNEYGCTSSAHATYTVIEPTTFIPNIFTPNGDLVFDTWDVNYTGDEAFYIGVHDRWGKVMFETTDPEVKWKGTDAGGKPVSDGVYYYSLRIGNRVYNGNVTIIR